MSSDLVANELAELGGDHNDHPPPPPGTTNNNSPSVDENAEIPNVHTHPAERATGLQDHHELMKSHERRMGNHGSSPSLEMSFGPMGQYQEENMPFPNDFYMNQMPSQQMRLQKGPEDWDSLAVTQVVSRVAAEMNLSDQREYAIARHAALRMAELHHHRMSQAQAIPQFLQQPQLQRQPFQLNRDQNAMLTDMGGMQGPVLPQLQMASTSTESLKAEPRSKRKLTGHEDFDTQSSVSGNSSKRARGSTGTARWTTEQDEALKEAVKKYEGRNWKAIAELVEGRDHVQCLQRWKKVLRPGLVKGHWSKEEDDLLLSLIQDEKMHSWAMVASKIKGRTAKQCRERWSLNLDPGINRAAWTQHEDEMLLQLYEKMGGKWSEIKSEFNGRTENAVKTRYKSLQRAKAREWTPEQDRALVALRLKHGKNWVAIKKELPGRSRNAIKVRCKTLEYDGNMNT